MIKGIDHIGIAVKDINETAKIYKNFGLEIEEIHEFPGRKVKIAFISVGESRIELLQPTDPESHIAKFIEENGEGIHHLCLIVDRIEEILEKLKKRGIQLRDEKPRVVGIGQLSRITFLDPKSTGGVLLELCEKTDSFSGHLAF